MMAWLSEQDDAKTVAEAKAAAEVPTLAEAAADVRRDLNNSVALQGGTYRTKAKPPLIIVVNYPELLVVLEHAEAAVTAEVVPE